MSTITSPDVTQYRRLAVLGVGAAVLCTALLLVGAPSDAIVRLVAVGVGALVLVALVLVRFELFIHALLVLRASLDIVKSSGGGETTVTDPTTLATLLLLVAGVLWLATSRPEGRTVPGPDRFEWALTAVAAAAGISTVASIDPVLSAVELLRLLSIVVLVLVVRRLAHDRAAALRLVWSILLSAIVPIVVGLLAPTPFGSANAYEVKNGISRLSSTFEQSNNLARYLVVIVVLAWAMQYVAEARRSRIALRALVLLSGGLLVVTFTIGAWAGAAIAVAVLLWPRDRRILVGAAVAGAIVLATVPAAQERLASVGSVEASAAEVSNDTFSWRLRHWGNLLQLSTVNPVNGMGLDTTVQVSDGGKEPHNDYLQVLLEMGLLGALAFGWAILEILRACAHAVRRVRDPELRMVAVATSAIFLATLVMALAANIVSSLSYMWYLSALIAVTAALPRIRDGHEPVAATTAPAIDAEAHE